MDLCVHFGKPAFIVLYLLYICILVFQINIFQFNSIPAEFVHVHFMALLLVS